MRKLKNNFRYKSIFFSFVFKKMSKNASNFNLSKRASIHSTAILVGGNIIIEDDVEVGPYCILNGDIKLEKGVKLVNHVTISGNTTIGEGTVIYSFASIGSIPQDIKYKGEKSFLEIGKNNVIREYVTISPGTEHGGLYTKVGDNNLLMISSHIGHDCIIGNNCIISNSVGIAGHVIVEDDVIIGGNSGIHQFVRIGTKAMVGGMSGVGCDIPPFSLYTGNRVSKLRGLNIIGLKRHGFSTSVIKQIREAYNTIFSTGIFNSTSISENAKKLLETTTEESVKTLINFILNVGERNICMWDKNSKQEEDV